MGMLISRLLDRFAAKESRILLLGLDAAGKTTLLFQLKLGERISSIPTVGFNVETVTYGKMTMTLWDIGGQKKIRSLWNHYYKDNDALIFMVDASDRDRFELAAEELNGVLASPDMAGVPVLVFANKQDMPSAASPSEVSAALGLRSLRDRPWFVQGCSCATGDGVYDGMDRLLEMMD